MCARAPSWDLDGMFFRIALSLIGLRVLDDNFIQPAAGTSPADHLVSGLALLALLGLAAYVQPKLSGFWQGTLTALLGVIGIVFGLDAVHYTRELGLSAGDVSGFVSIGAGLALLGLGAATLFRTRSHDGHRAWRYGRRTLLVASLYLVIPALLFPLGMGYVGARTARAVVPADHLDTPHETVTFKTKDGLELEGWYIPSRNGAAVISFPGRKGPQRQARMLARHGYGVLLFDRRGEGRSEGVPNAFGWGGDEDITAAIRYLQSRPDVEPGRIGGIGLSVGGELMLETAAETDDLAAVVSEGAGARMFSEEMREDMPAVDKVLTTPSAWVKQASIAVFSNQAPPTDLKDLVGRISPRPLLLIAAPKLGVGEELNRGYAHAAGESATLWEIPESRHTGGIEARPAEYERRVVGFFDEALR